MEGCSLVSPADAKTDWRHFRAWQGSRERSQAWDWLEIRREFLPSFADTLKPSCCRTSNHRSAKQALWLIEAVDVCSRKKSWHLMKSLWRGKKKSFATLSPFVSAPIQNSGFLNTDFYINNSLLHVIFLVAGISFHYRTKHVSSFLCACQTTVSLMTHAEKSSDPLRGLNKPQGAFLLLDAPMGSRMRSVFARLLLTELLFFVGGRGLTILLYTSRLKCAFHVHISICSAHLHFVGCELQCAVKMFRCCWNNLPV